MVRLKVKGRSEICEPCARAWTEIKDLRVAMQSTMNIFSPYTQMQHTTSIVGLVHINVSHSSLITKPANCATPTS